MEWVDPKRLSDALQHTGAAGTTLLRAIFDRAAAGLLRAKAQRIVENGKVLDGNDVPAEFWVHGLKTLQSGAWNLGDISVSVPKKGDPVIHLPIQAFGIKFAREDAEAMGAVFDGAPVSAEVAREPATETLKEWASRVVDCKLPIGGLSTAIVRSSWRGAPETVPMLKVALGALQEEWVKRGRTGPGKPPQA